MMRILMLTPQVDRRGWVTGFIHSWIAALADHPQVERLYVICLEMGDYDLPDHVQVASMGKEKGYGRLRELITLWREVLKVIGEVDIVFGHMIPRFMLAAMPLIKLYRRPGVQWYTHRQVSGELRLVHALADQVVTASPESFPLVSDKVIVLGHGIDTEVFHPAEDAPDPSTGRLILAVGRLSPIKHYETLIEAAALVRQKPGFEDVKVAIAGGTTPENGEAYAEELRALARRRGVAERIDFLGAIPHEEIAGWFRRAAVTVNLCPTGGVDKAVIESMASGVPVVVRNETFLSLLGDEKAGLFCERLDSELVAGQLAGVLSQSEAERRALGEKLRERMMAEYALSGFIDRLVTVFERLIPSPAPPS